MNGGDNIAAALTTLDFTLSTASVLSASHRLPRYIYDSYGIFLSNHYRSDCDQLICHTNAPPSQIQSLPGDSLNSPDDPETNPISLFYCPLAKMTSTHLSHGE